MDQTSKKKIKKMLELPDHDLMEKIFGKRAMKEIDRLVGGRSDDAEKEETNDAMKQIITGGLWPVKYIIAGKSVAKQYWSSII